MARPQHATAARHPRWPVTSPVLWATGLVLAVAVLVVFQRDTEEPFFFHDQPYFNGLTRWGRSWVARDHHHRLYVGSRSQRQLTPLVLPEVDKVLDVAASGEQRFVLGQRGSALRLLAIDGVGNTAALPLPPAIEGDAWRMVASRDTLAIVDRKGGWSCRLPACLWSSLRPTKALWMHDGWPHPLALHAGSLYVARNDGEFGSGLLAVRLDDGAASLVQNDGEAATGLGEDSQGRLWATWGLAHLGLREGRLRVLEGERWRDVARCHSDSNYDHTPWKSWPFEATSFEGVAVGERDRVYLLTSTLGVLELDGSGWRRRTPRWSGHQYVQGLLVDGAVATVVAGNVGILRFDLEAPGFERLTVEGDRGGR